MIVIGLSGGFRHDAGACLVRDGRLIAMVEEERLRRIKRASKLPPVLAVLSCLHQANLTMQDVDAIALSWNPDLDPENRLLHSVMKDFRKHDAFRNRELPPIVAIDHHRSHAASSYYSSGFEEATIVVIDGQGENHATTIAYGKSNKITILYAFDPTQSLGAFYDAVGYYIGLGSDSAGKTMGLASYGKPIYSFPQIKITEDGYELAVKRPDMPETGLWYSPIRRQWIALLEQQFGPPAKHHYQWNPTRSKLVREFPISDIYKDVAASAQYALENLITHIVQVAIRATGSRNVVLAGGVALNCSANGVLARSGIADDLYIFPAAHDAGAALGAALELASLHGEEVNNRIEHAYWGPSFDGASIEHALRSAGYSARYCQDIASETASLLANNFLVGWFQGRMEIGPRALGHRSILANPHIGDNVVRLNSIKGRETWRPFAPSMLEEEAPRVFENSRPSPFMLQAFRVRDEMLSQLPAVVHVDQTARPQTLVEATSPAYRKLLEYMKQSSGVGIVLNTSFNHDEEPIVCTPYDALRTFSSMGLDALVMGNFLLTKRG